MTRKHHLALVGCLLGLSCIVQVVVIRRAETTGLDTVRFVVMAQSIEQHGLLTAMRTHGQQPLFPVLIWMVHGLLRATSGEFPATWALSAQVAAAIPLVLAVVPLYLLILRLIYPAAAVGASLFFCLLPEVARLGADGLADSTHLLLFTVALWAIVEYFHRRKTLVTHQHDTPRDRRLASLWLLLAGGAVAMASLARAEVLVLAAALTPTLLVLQLLHRRRVSWITLSAASICFLLGLALVWAPYLIAAEVVTPQTALARILGRHHVEPPPLVLSVTMPPDTWHLPDGQPMSFDAKEPTVSLRQRGYPAALIRFGRKLADAIGYWIGLLTLFGAWRLRHYATSNADWFVRVFFVLFSLLAIRFAAKEGYLDPRHLLTLVVIATGSAAYGALEIGSLLARRFQIGPLASYAQRWLVSSARRLLGDRFSGDSIRSTSATSCYYPRPPRLATVTFAGCAVILLAAVACLPQAIAQLHHSRLGHRAAGEWLARQADPTDAILDTLGWAGLYCGRKTYLYQDATAALSDPHLAYIVIEDRETDYSSARSQTLRWLIESAGQYVAEFPNATTRRWYQQPVVVYRWYPERFREQLPCVGTTSPNAVQPATDSIAVLIPNL